MKHTNLGASTLSVSRVCLGTMHLGGRTDEAESFAVMDRALEMGINFFDTANVYGFPKERGLTETIIGRWLAQDPARRERIVLATKVYNNMNEGDGPNRRQGFSAYRVRRHLEDSLRRLQTDHVDLYQVHHIDRNVTLEEFWGTMDRHQDDGKFLYAGASNFTGWGLAQYQAAARARGRLGFVSEQSMFSLLCRYAELEVLPSSDAHGIGVIPYMPLAGGLLSGNVDIVEASRTAQVAAEYGIEAGPGNSKLKAFAELAGDLGVRPHSLAIAWVLSRPAVASAIVGVRTVKHLDGLAEATELELSNEVTAKLDELFPPSAGRPLRVGRGAPEAYAW
ncbi:MAG: aldo/keto reductase [Planctomycetota bacterium]